MMPDREKVIEGLQNLRESIATDFIHEADQAVGTIDDAMALLKEKEAVKPVITPWKENEDGEVIIAKRECGRCGCQFFTEKPNYCENCGVPILWEGR